MRLFEKDKQPGQVSCSPVREFLYAHQRHIQLLALAVRSESADDGDLRAESRKVIGIAKALVRNEFDVLRAADSKRGAALEEQARV